MPLPADLAVRGLFGVGIRGHGKLLPMWPNTQTPPPTACDALPSFLTQAASLPVSVEASPYMIPSRRPPLIPSPTLQPKGILTLVPPSNHPDHYGVPAFHINTTSPISPTWSPEPLSNQQFGTLHHPCGPGWLSHIIPPYPTVSLQPLSAVLQYPER